MDRKDGAAAHQALTIATWNADGLKYRREELEAFLFAHDISVLLVSETFLKPGDSFHIQGFRCYRKDRKAKKGGGVAVFVRGNPCCEKIDLDDLESSLEAVGVRLKICGTMVSFFAVYSPPSNYITESDLKRLLESPATIVGGDLNAKDPSWGSRTTNQAGRVLRRLGEKLDLLQFWGPEDATHLPTNPRYRGDVLDIFLTYGINDPMSVQTIHALSSDHFPVILNLEGRHPNQNDNVPPLTRVDWISYEWNLRNFEGPPTLSTREDVEEEAALFTRGIQDALDASRKTAVPNIRNKLGLSLWQKELISKKNKTKAKYSRFHDPRDRIALIQLQQQVRVMLKEHKESEWVDQTDDLNDDLGKFWKFLGRIKRRKDPNAPLRMDGRKIFEDAEKAEVMANFFENQFKNEKPSDEHTVRAVTLSTTALNHMHVTESPEISYEEVQLKLRKLTWKRAPGQDNIPNRALSLLPEPAVRRYTRLLNNMVKLSAFPKVWKEAVIVSIPKNGKDPSIPDNRRPISLLPGLAKIAEGIIKERINDFVEERGLVEASQFGFRKKLAAVNQAAYLDAIARSSTRKKKRVIVALLDVAKAYDRVWREGLIHKLITINLPLWMTKLIASWMEERSFRVRSGNSLSTPRIAVEGLPQGSALSPLLYNIFVYDIPKFERKRCLHTLQFADDTAVVSIGTSFSQARKIIEKALYELCCYADRWKISLNSQKTEVLFFGNERPADPYIEMAKKRIPLKPRATYLGVIFDRKLNYVRHTKTRKARAKLRLRSLSFLTRECSGLSFSNRLKILNNVVLPVASYGQEVWVAGSEAAREAIVTTQNVCIRKAMGVPWFVKNIDVRRDVQAEDLVGRAWSQRKKMVASMENHHDEAIRSIAATLAAEE